MSPPVPADRNDPTRREAVATLAAVVATAGACARGAPSGTVGPRRRRFAPVAVDPNRIIRTVAGLRPFRPSGFVVRAERLGEKLLVHDYGHGGGGITLSWGTADLAVALAAESPHRECAVLGCGAVGLATARLLQRRGWSVTIYAKDLPPETTSNIAGGQWSPYSVFDPEHTTPSFSQQFERASRLAYRHFQDLPGRQYGVKWVDNVYLSDQPPSPPRFMTAMPELFPNLETLDAGDHPFDAPHAWRVATMLVEPPIYLQAMLRDVFLAGGRLEVRRFDSLNDVANLPAPVVFNCTGLGSRELIGDDELTPIKGQLTVLLPQPEVDYILLSNGLYMMPRTDGILLGGTFERGNWDLTPDPSEADRILTGHQRLFEPLR